MTLNAPDELRSRIMGLDAARQIRCVLLIITYFVPKFALDGALAADECSFAAAITQTRDFYSISRPKIYDVGMSNFRIDLPIFVQMMTWRGTGGSHDPVRSAVSNPMHKSRLQRARQSRS